MEQNGWMIHYLLHRGINYLTGANPMPNTPEQEKLMDESAEAFKLELQTLLDRLEPQQQHAIGLFVDLVQKYYFKAGYKRIFNRAFKARAAMN